MYFKEFLRVRKIFAAFAIALVAIALLIVVLSGHAQVNVDTNAAHVHAAHSGSTKPSEGTPSVNEVDAPGIKVSSSDDRFPFAALLAIAGFIAAIFGTALGTCLASENCGHLDVAWTRPVSRIAYAARIMLVDVTGIATMFAFVVLLSLALVYVTGFGSRMYLGDNIWPVEARFVPYPFAWFGLIAALTASTRGKGGAIAGFTWVGASLLLALLAFNLAPAVHTVVLALNHLNPLYYGSYSTGPDAAQMMHASTPAALSGLLGIAIIGIAAALVQWRRLEA